jgi:hypothetical protein
MTKKRSVVFNAITAEQFRRSFNLEGPGYLIGRAGIEERRPDPNPVSPARMRRAIHSSYTPRQRSPVLQIYVGIRPLLVILGSVPVIPSLWRADLKTFAPSLEALAATPGSHRRLQGGEGPLRCSRS